MPLIFVLTLLYVAVSTNFSIIFFLLFLLHCVVCALMCILSISPINSIFFLVALFLNVAAGLIALQWVYLGLILVIVYVGALAIFFLFTLMLLNIKVLYTFRYNKTLYTKISDFLFFFLILVHFFIFLSHIYDMALDKNIQLNISGNLLDFNSLIFSVTDLYAQSLYSIYGSVFILLGIFLFIIMIGVILLIQQNNNLLRVSNKNPWVRNSKVTIFKTYFSNN